MSPRLIECEAMALDLPLSERAALAERLLASLDASDDAETERPWVEEAERRYAAYKAGQTTARPAADVLRDARASLA